MNLNGNFIYLKKTKMPFFRHKIPDDYKLEVVPYYAHRKIERYFKDALLIDNLSVNKTICYLENNTFTLGISESMSYVAKIKDKTYICSDIEDLLKLINYKTYLND